MIIDDQIRDEKLQYNINRKAAKILALSSGKIDKYEYLTDEEILPSDQQKIIEQAKFTYSPLGKAFEKQMKTIEDQGEKQIKAIQKQGQVKTIKKYDYDEKDSPLISKQKEIFNELMDERIKEITELNKKVDLNDLVYRHKGKSRNEKFDKYDNTLNLFNKIRNGEIKLAGAKNDQIILKSHLDEIKKGNKKKKIKRAKKRTIQYWKLYKARNEAIKFFDDYSLIASEAKNKITKGTGLKILTPKQMLQKLPIALVQVKAGNNSEKLLNEIRQIVYSLYQSKEITKKVSKNIIKSIQ